MAATVPYSSFLPIISVDDNGNIDADWGSSWNSYVNEDGAVILDEDLAPQGHGEYLDQHLAKIRQLLARASLALGVYDDADTPEAEIEAASDVADTLARLARAVRPFFIIEEAR